MRKHLSSLSVQLALAVLVAAAIGIAVGLGSGSSQPAEAPPLDLPADDQRAGAQPDDGAAEPLPAPRSSTRQVFAHTCGMCHALADAKTAGGFGPDLDAVRPSAAEVRRMIRTGSIDGVMQPDLVTGAEARRVAAYVARVAGGR